MSVLGLQLWREVGGAGRLLPTSPAPWRVVPRGPAVDIEAADGARIVGVDPAMAPLILALQPSAAKSGGES
jgi:hypothetical protein